MLTVTLSHASNPDIDSNGGYWQEANRSARRHVVPVQSIDAAAAMCRQYIDRNGLGGGNWTGGQVMRDLTEQVAYISYNGRAWKGDGKSMEPA